MVYLFLYIEKCVVENWGGEFCLVVFLICDVSGVLFFVLVLSEEVVVYYFLSGYIVKVGFIEIGFISDIELIFLICFGVFFFLCLVGVYVEFLIKCVKVFGVKVYLVNIGWIGGFYGIGSCFDIFIMCVIIDVIVLGNLVDVEI